MKKGSKKGKKAHRTPKQRAATKRMIAARKRQLRGGHKGRRHNPATPRQEKLLERAAAKLKKGEGITAAEERAMKAVAKSEKAAKKPKRKPSKKPKAHAKGKGKSHGKKKPSTRRASAAMTRASAHGPTIHVSQHLLGGPKSTSKKRPAFKKTGRKTSTTYKSKKGNTKITVTRATGRANPHGNYVNIAILGGTLVVGVLLAKVVDAMIATRTPTGGQHPWYGKDAELRIQARPDGMRMAAQVAIAAVGIGGGFMLKKYPKLAYAATGIGLAAAVMFVVDLVWKRGLPKVIPVKTGDEMNFTNRVAPETSDAVQARIAALIKLDNDAIASGDATQLPMGQRVSSTDATRLDGSYAFPATDGTQPMTGNAAPIALGAGGEERSFKGWPKQRQLGSGGNRVPQTLGCGGQGCGQCSECDQHRLRMQAAAASVKGLRTPAMAGAEAACRPCATSPAAAAPPPAVPSAPPAAPPESTGGGTTGTGTATGTGMMGRSPVTQLPTRIPLMPGSRYASASTPTRTALRPGALAMTPRSTPTGTRTGTGMSFYGKP